MSGRVVWLLVIVLLGTSLHVSAQNTNTHITLQPSDDVSGIINSAPPGTTFLFSPGIYRFFSAEPKDGDQFMGEYGAVLSGAKLLTNFAREGAFWVVDGQLQENRPHGNCQENFERCMHPEDVFFDNVPLRHAASFSDLRPGYWHFNYAADKIYLADNPEGHIIETSVTPLAFFGSANQVTIRDLVIEKYANRAQTGAIHGDSSNHWTVENVIVRLNHGTGIRLGNLMKITGSKILQNGQIGIAGSGSGILLEDSEIAYNNYAGFNSTWEGGGSKFVDTTQLIVRGNYVHHNDGPGLWTDIDNIDTLYENNLVIYNQRIGIYHEISYQAVIRNNISGMNGAGQDNWLWGGQIMVSSSSGVEIYGNQVYVAAEYGNGITIVQQNRGEGKYGPLRSYNNIVRDNVVVHFGAGGRSGVATDWDGEVFWQEANNVFDRNTYYVMSDLQNHWGWNDAELNWQQMRSLSQELNGSIIITAPAPELYPIFRDCWLKPSGCS